MNLFIDPWNSPAFVRLRRFVNECRIYIYDVGGFVYYIYYYYYYYVIPILYYCCTYLYMFICMWRKFNIVK